MVLGRSFIILLFISICFCPLEASVDHPEVIVEGNAFQDEFSSSSSTTDIPSRLIETKQENFAAEPLKDIEGIFAKAYSFPGTFTTIDIRGANNYNTIVEIDGVLMNDPGVGGAFDFSDLLTHDIESIDIIKGPRALFYDARAAGGIIRIQTKRGKGKRKITGKVEGGSFSTRLGSFAIQEAGERFDYYAGGVLQRSGDGAQKNRLRGNRLADAYQNKAFSTRLGFSLAPRLETEVFFKGNLSRIQLNEGAAPFNGLALPRTSDDHSRKKQYVAKLGQRLSTFDGRVVHEASFSSMNNRQISTSTGQDFVTDGQNQQLKYQLEATVNDRQKIRGGVEYLREIANILNVGKKNIHTTAVVGEYQAQVFSCVHLTSGARVLDHRLFKRNVSYWAGVDYSFDEATTFSINYGEGYRYPLLMDLIQSDPFKIGNPDLRPERNRSFEAGIERTFLKKQLKLKAKYFHITLNELVVTRRLPLFLFQKINEGRRRSQGIETSFDYQISKDLKATGAYTYIQAVESRNSLFPISLPRHKITGTLFYSVTPRLNLFTNAGYQSPKRDEDFRFMPARSVTLPESIVVSLGGSYDVNDTFELYGRAENVFNQKYENVYGYGARDFGVYFGVRMKWL
jgi:vitamin B12 transporter